MHKRDIEVKQYPEYLTSFSLKQNIISFSLKQLRFICPHYCVPGARVMILHPGVHRSRLDFHIICSDRQRLSNHQTIQETILWECICYFWFCYYHIISPGSILDSRGRMWGSLPGSGLHSHLCSQIIPHDASSSSSSSSWCISSTWSLDLSTWHSGHNSCNLLNA